MTFIKRHENLEKEIMEGRMQGRRNRRRWRHDITEMVDINTTQAGRIGQDRHAHWDAATHAMYHRGDTYR